MRRDGPEHLDRGRQAHANIHGGLSGAIVVIIERSIKEVEMPQFKDVFKQEDSRIYSLFLYTDGHGHFDPQGNMQLDYWPHDATLNPSWLIGRPLTSNDIVLIWAYIESNEFLLIDVYTQEKASFMFNDEHVDCEAFIRRYRNGVRLRFDAERASPRHKCLQSHDDLFHISCAVDDAKQATDWNDPQLRKELFKAWCAKTHRQSVNEDQLFLLTHDTILKESQLPALGEILPDFNHCICPQKCLGIFETANIEGLRSLKKSWKNVRKFHMGFPSAALGAYIEFLETDQHCATQNLIYFGAPGTGKSYKLNETLMAFDDRYERVTFYSDYLHAQFVGSLRPSMESDPDAPGRDRLVYRFTPGPFAQVLVRALNDPRQEYALVIEEINRADAASVFGDLFQLLDRNSEGFSEYSITASTDFTDYLLKKLNDDGKRHLSKLTKQNVENLPLGTALRIAIPANMSLLATMNSADQGVYPLDTAFKRRWDFMYVSIDDEQQQTDRKWDEQRQKINHLLLNKAHVNEDKLIGPFFIKQSIPWASKEFSETFKYKVIMYLFEDAARYKRKEIFADYTSGRNTLGKLFEDWDDKNFAIFSDMDSVADFPRK